jgi:hypothetical protein
VDFLSEDNQWGRTARAQSWKLWDQVREDGLRTGELHVATPMQKMAIDAIYIARTCRSRR